MEVNGQLHTMVSINWKLDWPLNWSWFSEQKNILILLGFKP